jgi:LacI family transcriptional regulator
MNSNNKRVTIYDLAKELNVSASYISKALNNHPLVSLKMREKVQEKAIELKYKHNSYAANLRKGISRTIGVVVPQINSFFSEAIAGIEEVCSNQDYGLVICRSHDSYENECRALDTLMRQNVDCILISIATETYSGEHLQNIINNGIPVIQFDRFVGNFNAFRVVNNNEEMAYLAVKHLINKGYKKIVYLGGTEVLTIYRLRKEGYLRALKEANLSISTDLIFDNAFSEKNTIDITIQLLSSNTPPDAFFTGSDYAALNVLQVADNLNINVPNELGIIGSGNDILTRFTKPRLSAIDQKSMELGRKAANLYFEILAKGKNKEKITGKEEIVLGDILTRESTAKNQ